MRFIGNIEAKVDAKGRVFLPASFRKALNQEESAELVLRKDVFQPCLVIYPRAAWDEQTNQVRNRLSRWNKEEQMIYRQFVSDVEELELDANGRFLLPKRYLKLAGILQAVKFIGMGDSIEIWSNDEPQKPFIEPEQFGKALEQLMSNPTVSTEE